MIRIAGSYGAAAGIVSLTILFSLSSVAAVGFQTIPPRADGTLVDGGAFGPFDGVADDWDWSFNGSSYEGAITLSLGSQSAVEHRVVFEYDLSGVLLDPPVLATLSLSLRGAPVFPLPDAVVHVYAYPADLLETPEDFAAGSGSLQASVSIAPYSAKATYVVDVSRAVNEALRMGTPRVAFRLQIDPNTPFDNNQAFLEAEDRDPSTKPTLMVEQAPVASGDLNADGSIDLVDFSGFPFCLAGPKAAIRQGCEAYDFDGDADIDQRDVALFLTYLSPAS